MLRIIVPARAGSTRLPNKLLQPIGHFAVVQHVIRRVEEAAFHAEWEWALATDSPEIADLCPQTRIVMTPSELRTGSDRVAYAAKYLQAADDDIIVNVQADMPFIDPDELRQFLISASKGGAWDVMTAYHDHKQVRAWEGGFERITTPVHIGLYAYKMPALRRFAELEQVENEKTYGLEQLRAFASGMSFEFVEFGSMPLEINTPEDLAAAQLMAACIEGVR